MKYGCCGSMIAVQPDGTGIEIAEQLKKIGYDYIELSLSHMMRLTNYEFDEMIRKLLDAGIKCEACNNFFPPDLKLTGPSVRMEPIVLYTEKALERASRLGAEIVVFGSGPAKNVEKGFPMSKAWEQLVGLLRIINDIANKYEITIVIEPLRKLECNIINSVSEGLCLAKEINKSNIKLLVDYYHMTIENESLEILTEAKNYIRHVHLARVDGRTFPKEIDEDRYSPFIKSLKQINYNRRISVEAYSKNFNEDAKLALGFLKKYFN